MLAIVDRVTAGEQIEDDRVELKARWPAPGHKVARQIAGHANTSAGESLLWLVGVDEGARTVTDPGPQEPSTWWNQTRRWFDDVYPELIDMLVVPVGSGRSVIAVTFETDRAPYLVSTESGGRVQREVPWRVGNETRSAHRREILRTLVAQARTPGLDPIAAQITLASYREVSDDHGYGDHEGRTVGDVRLTCHVEVFVSTREPVNLPQHRQSLTLAGTSFGPLRLMDYSFKGPMGGPRKVSQSGISYQSPLETLVIVGRKGVLVNASGELSMMASVDLDVESASLARDARRIELRLEMGVDQSDRPALLTVPLHRIRVSNSGPPTPHDPWLTTAVFRYTPN